MAKKKQASGNDIPEWIVTYGDLMSLLLCFFILLAAFSEMKDPDEFQKVLERIKEALGVDGGMGYTDDADNAANTVISALSQKINRGADGKFMDQNAEANVTGPSQNVSIVHDGNFHAIGGSFAFPAGKTSLGIDLEHRLREEVAPKIKDRRNIVRVVGHAHGFQDQTAGSYLQVSFDRGIAVRDYLVDQCGIDPKILRVVAAGEYEPMAGAGSDAAQHRRVQIYMTDKTIDQLHPDPNGTGRNKD